MFLCSFIFIRQRRDRASGIDTTPCSLYTEFIQKDTPMQLLTVCVSPGDVHGGSVRHTFRVPGAGFPWDKIQERGWNTATALPTQRSLTRENKCKTNVAQEPVDRCASPCRARENCFSRSR